MKLFDIIDASLKNAEWKTRDDMCWYPSQNLPKRYHLWYDRRKNGATEWLIIKWGTTKSYDIDYQEWIDESFGRTRKFSFTKQADVLELLTNLMVFK